MAKLKPLPLCPFSITLEALKRIAFDPEVARAKQMQELAYRTYIDATEPCPARKGTERCVDDCGVCDETGRVPRKPHAQ